MKKTIYVILTILIIAGAYFACFRYLKTSGVRILLDKTGHITKHSKMYLHYKIFNKKLLNDYGVDFRVVIVKEKTNTQKFANTEFQKIATKHRKKAHDFVLVVLNKSGQMDIKESKDLQKIYNEEFLSKIKNYKTKNMSELIIKITEDFLDRAIETKG